MVKPLPSKQVMSVRFRLPAPDFQTNQTRHPAAFRGSENTHLLVREQENKEDAMFSGLTRAMVIINIFMLGAPIAMMLAMDGSDWLDRLQMMSPVF